MTVTYTHRASPRWLFSVVVAVAMLCLSSVSARADDPESQANAIYREAKALAEAGEHEQAIEKLGKALAVFRHPLIVKKRAECYDVVGDVERALEDYRAYLSLLKPKEKAELASAKARIVALEAALAEPVRVTIVAHSSDGETELEVDVSIDGGTARRTPITTPMAPGRHRVALIDKRYVGEAREVTVRAAHPTTVAFAARNKRGRVTITTNRPTFDRVDLLLDATAVELKPEERTTLGRVERDLSAGKHVLVCRAPGVPQHETAFDVPAEGRVEVSCRFAESSLGVRRVWGFTLLSTGLATLVAGSGILISYGLDVKFADDTDQELITNKHIIGGVLAGAGAALAIGSIFLIASRSSGSAGAEPPVMWLAPLPGGGAIGGAARF